MRWTRSSGSIVVAAMIAGVAPLAAQAKVNVFGGGGAQLPVGDFKNDSLSPHANGSQEMLGFEVPFNRAHLRLRVDASYGTNDIIGPWGDKTNIIAGNISVVYPIRNLAVHPYFIGGVGAFNDQYQDADGAKLHSIQLSVNAGAGLAVGPPAIQLFTEVRLVYGIYGDSGTPYVPIVAGIRLGWGRE